MFHPTIQSNSAEKEMYMSHVMLFLPARFFVIIYGLLKKSPQIREFSVEWIDQSIKLYKAFRSYYSGQ